MEVVFPPEIEKELQEEEMSALRAVLREDPRPAYQDDPDRVYAFEFSGRHIEFRVENGTLRVLRASRESI